MVVAPNLTVLGPTETGASAAVFRPETPYHMVWLATNACNARCVHCSSDAAKRLPGELSTAEAKRLLDDLAEMGVFNVAISGGEALTRPDIFEIVEHGASLGIKLGLGSNGSTVTERVVRLLAGSGLERLQISIDGVEATHDRARRWPGLYRKAERAVVLGLQGGLRVHVCFTAHRINHGELRDVVARCVALGVHRFNLSRFVPTGRGDAALDLTPREWERLVADFEAIRREQAGRIEFTTHLAQSILANPELGCQSGFVGCQAGVGQGCIGPIGQVTPCVMLPVVVGNIRKKPLREIWMTSPVLAALRDRDRLGGWCHSCTFREKCGGCRAVAFAHDGDFMAADPRCWLFAVDEPNCSRPERRDS
jgi:radical SAM protein with 4Fe4S-binding SPASM domain